MPEPMADADRPVFSRAEKTAAWEWLRKEAIDGDNHHAAVAIVEWQAYYNALKEIADDRGDDARRLKFMAVDALTHSERMGRCEPSQAPSERGRNEAGSDAGAASIPESGE